MDPSDWKHIKLVIFDVDGTLYNQKKLRHKMFFSLAGHYLTKPSRWSDLNILKTFRQEREKHKDLETNDLQNEQYAWCREKTGKDLSRIRQVVDHWIVTYPLRLLNNLVYPGLHELFDALKKAGIRIAVLSDYPAEEKMSAMGLQADLVTDAADSRVNALKPNPAGLLYITGFFMMDIRDCIFIGDRDDTDGEAARRIGMKYLIIDKDKMYTHNYFQSLARQIESG